ncbi:hypothetical protein [Aureimonas sp. ME7]|uniref:hypothetical protein n=1 Tax=Aureimonas sp. ME7 TaxID=2744252 RepID=UPI0015F4BC5D|nr:hypothetical protein [Aureimonas sp. ME7]
MATTRLQDVIYGPLFLPTTIQRIAQLSRLRNSPIVSADPEIQRFANGPGDIVQMPFWNDLTGASNVSSDDPAQAAVPNKLTQGQDMARKVRRNNGWQSANLVAAVLAEDPLDVVAQLIAEYWVRDEETVLGQVINGVFASSGMAGNKLDVASEAGATTPVKLDPEVAANAYALLGEYGHAFTPIAGSVRLTILDGEGRQASVGTPGGNVVRYAGVIAIQVFTEGGKGTAASRELEDALSDLFRNAEIDSIRCGIPYVSGSVEDPPFLMQTVMVPFTRDSFHA